MNPTFAEQLSLVQQQQLADANLAAAHAITRALLAEAQNEQLRELLTEQGVTPPTPATTE